MSNTEDTLNRKSFRRIGFVSLAALFTVAATAILALARFSNHTNAGWVDFFFEEPQVPTIADDDSLKFPISDKKYLGSGENPPPSIDLDDPKNIRTDITYDPDSNVFILDQLLNNLHYRNPVIMDYDDYTRLRFRADEEEYFRQRLQALTMFNNKPQLPTLSKEGIFDRLFGGNNIKIEPNGAIELTTNGFWEHRENPMMIEQNRRYFVPEFSMNMNMNLVAQIGDKLKLNISNSTNPTSLTQNLQTVEYTGKEDEILKKIELGMTSFPLRSSLITGVQSLFGIKAQLQFGNLWVTSVLSQQKSQRKSITIQNGGQTQNFEIRADNYDENRNFLLAQYFRNNYNKALENFPIINSQVQITKIEVWITNRTGIVNGVRDVMAFMDLGEKEPYVTSLTNPSGSVLPDNRSNTLYDQLQANPAAREQATATPAAISIGLTEGRDFQRVTMRQLSPSEYTFNPQLGYISLSSTVNPDDVLAVSYRYTHNGNVYQVGEFSDELPPDSTNQRVIFCKLIKGISNRPQLPIWDLMMKNVYSLGYGNISKEDFRLDVFYLDPGGGEKRYLPEGSQSGIPIIRLLNLDRLNYQNDPVPDGVFDFVEGITIQPQMGKIIFPVLEPFGEDLKQYFDGDPALERKYLYQVLYDSTKTIAQQRQQNNRFVIKGSFRSSVGSDIYLGFSVPEGSVTVTAGGQVLTEGADYTVDYSSGRLRILNQGILQSGTPINIQFEDNAAFGMVTQGFVGTRLDYFVNDKLTLGATYMKLSERPFGYKTRVGDDPIKNTVIGVDAMYQDELPKLTKLLDKLPFYSTTAPSMISASIEGAALLPGHHRFVNVAGDEGGTQYIDDFEGSAGTYDLKFPAFNWSLASVPNGATDLSGNILFPEASLTNDLRSGNNRALLAWYSIDPNLISGNTAPQSVKSDFTLMHYWRQVEMTEVFQNKTRISGQNLLATFDLAYYPSIRGPYNFDATDVDPTTGRLLNPQRRWAGIQRSIDNLSSDFEQTNVEYVTFWVMDPFMENPSSSGGYLYLNLGNVSEDVLKDGRMAFENGIDYPKDRSKLDETRYGFIPKFQQQITRAFVNDPAAREVQDVGYDLMDDDEEREKFKDYIDQMTALLGPGNPLLQEIINDPANDNFKHFRHTDYDAEGATVLQRYRRFNGPHGNSPVSQNDPNFVPGTALPESEDINRDNTLNESEAYYQYIIPLKPNMNVGEGFIVDKVVSNVKLKDGSVSPETWYQFKVPINAYDQAVGGIGDFRSIRFIRMFLTGFEDSVILRFAQLQLERNSWRRYQFSLMNPGENIPEDDLINTSFSVTTVSIEQNSNKEPVGYVMPPGIERQEQPISSGQSYQQDEQAIALQVCGLKDGDSRAIFKDFGNLDMRQYDKLRMFIHAESVPGEDPLKNGDVRAIIRFGTDFTHNYYEYQIPLEITPDGAKNADIVWPEHNRMEIDLNKLVQMKTARNDAGLPAHIPYSSIDDKGNIMIVVGNPNLAEVRNIMMGVHNPKKTLTTPDDDGQRKCVEVWFNELRLSGMNEKAGYASAANINVQLADLGNVNLSGSMHTTGYGNINQKLNERFRDNYYQFAGSTNLNLGKLLPSNWGVLLPVYFGYSENASTPEYDPYDKDILLKEKLKRVADPGQTRRDAQTYNSFTNFNVNNFRIGGNPNNNRAPMPWSLQNFDLNYAYNRQLRRSPLLERDEYIDQRFGFNYSYQVKAKYIEPFKSLFKERSPYWNLIKEFNFNPIPSTITFRNDIRKLFGETIIRNINQDPYDLPALYFKNFTWERRYVLNWDLTRSINISYSGLNNSRIDEPYGRIITQEQKDTLWNNIRRLGRNTYYTHDIKATYSLPFKKIPALDWINVNATYVTQYFWTASSLLAASQGNTISNNQSRSINGQLNFNQLYNKSRYLRALNRSTPRQLNNNNPQQSKNNQPNQTQGKNEQESKKPSTQSLPPRPKKRIITIDSIPGHDTLAKKELRKQLRERRRLERARYRRELDNWKRRKLNIVPEMNTGTKAGLRLITSIKSINFNYNENMGTVLPGYMDSTTIFGINTSSLAPGLFAFGFQPSQRWLEMEAERDRITRDSIFNGVFQQQYQQNYTINAGLEPIPDLRIDLSLTSNFRKNYSEIFKYVDGNYRHLNPYEMGGFTVSYIGLKTMFNQLSATQMSENFRNMLAYRQIISRRLGEINPYTAGEPDPLDPGYSKGYGRYSQDVVIPAFVAAYTGRDPEKAPLILYESRTSRNNPFRNFAPMPNWNLRYTGLNKLPSLKDKVKTLTITHIYSGTLSMNSFMSHLFYQDFLGVGFPSFIDSVSGNYIPYFMVPSMTINESFSPLIGVDMQLANSFSLKVTYNKSRTLSLSLVDYQVSETKSSEVTVGVGYRAQGLNLPFSLLGVRRLDNDVNFRLDLGLRDDITVNSYMATQTVTATRGQRVLTINPRIDYIINDALQIQIFFDRRQSIPYVQQTFPLTSTRAGITLRYIFTEGFGL